MKYKRIHYYKGSPDPLRAICAVQPRWQLVEVHHDDHRGGGFYGVRFAGGAFEWRDGTPPAPCGIYCDDDWRPIVFTTRDGRRLPNLQAAQEAEEVRDG